MDREQLYKNLSELERQLQRVKSANEQVETVLKADETLVTEIRNYSAKAESLLTAMRNAYEKAITNSGKDAAAEVRRISSDLLDAFQKGLKTGAGSFQQSLDTALSSFEKLLDSKREDVENITAELKKAVKELSTASDSLPTVVKDLAAIPAEFERTIGESKAVLGDATKAVVAATDDLKKTSSELTKKLDEIPQAIKDAKRDIAQQTAEIAKTTSDLSNKIGFLRVALFAVLAIQVIQMILFFVMK